jgi:hypothetical protein
MRSSFSEVVGMTMSVPLADLSVAPTTTAADNRERDSSG